VKGVVTLTAHNGLYESKTDRLILHKDIVVTSPDYEALLTEAVINVRTGAIVSDSAVLVKMLQGTIRANRLEVAEQGAIIRFDRGVTLVLDNLPAGSQADAR
jgi:lipopolysaccharide export system protein LptC